MFIDSLIFFGPLIIILTLAILLLKFWRENRQLRQTLDHVTEKLENLQLSFHRFVPQDVVENIIDEGVSTRGERQDLTVLFTDLEGFTSLSETLDPEVVVRILNGYFRVMSQVVRKNHGFVARFLGDGILTLFGTPEPNPWHAQDAARTAIDMRQALRDYNQNLDNRGDPTLKMGVGVDTGPAMVGVLGSQELMEYTAIGDVVNTASRIESLTRETEHDILISQRLADTLDDRFQVEKLEPRSVKGKQEPLHPYSLLEITEQTPNHESA